jgi:hypothetical protein
MSTKSDCEGSNAVREMVSGEMPFKCRLWIYRGLHTTANLWKVFGKGNSVCLWNTCYFVAQLTRGVITNYHSTYVPSTTSRHISDARFSNVAFKWTWARFYGPLTNSATCSDESNNRLLRTFSTVRPIISYRRRPSPHDRLIMRFAQLRRTKMVLWQFVD